GRFVLLRLVGPKPRPNGAGDGWPVDIPAPVELVTSEGGTRRRARTRPLVVLGPTQTLPSRQIRWAVWNRGVGVGGSEGVTPDVNSQGTPPRKASSQSIHRPYRKPTQVGG